MNSKRSRRNFIKNATIGAISSALLPEVVSAAFEAENVKKISLKKNDVVLFQGDSITDWGRSYETRVPNTANALGSGFVLLAAGGLLLDHPEKNLLIHNKGIAGNKVFQLAERWDADCLAIKPDVLSILVGVNDFSHTLWYGYKGTVDKYLADYRELLHRTLTVLPNVQLIIGEPFVLKATKLIDDRWFPAFSKYQQAAKQVADEFKATFIPFQSVFDKALQFAPPNYWTADGIHPNIAGTALMARAWRGIIEG